MELSDEIYRDSADRSSHHHDSDSENDGRHDHVLQLGRNAARMHSHPRTEGSQIRKDDATNCPSDNDDDDNSKGLQTINTATVQTDSSHTYATPTMFQSRGDADFGYASALSDVEEGLSSDEPVIPATSVAAAAYRPTNGRSIEAGRRNDNSSLMASIPRNVIVTPSKRSITGSF